MLLVEEILCNCLKPKLSLSVECLKQNGHNLLEGGEHIELHTSNQLSCVPSHTTEILDTTANVVVAPSKAELCEPQNVSENSDKEYWRFGLPICP